MKNIIETYPATAIFTCTTIAAWLWLLLTIGTITSIIAGIVMFFSAFTMFAAFDWETRKQKK